MICSFYVCNDEILVKTAASEGARDKKKIHFGVWFEMDFMSRNELPTKNKLTQTRTTPGHDDISILGTTDRIEFCRENQTRA